MITPYKNQAYKIPARKAGETTGLYITLCTCCLAGSLCLLYTATGTAFFILRILQLILFFFAGFYATKRLIKSEDNFKAETLKKSFISIALQTGFVLTTTGLIYVVIKKDVWPMAFSSSAAFALPFSFKASWLLFNNIPKKAYTLWIPNKGSKEGTSVFLDCLAIKLRISKKPDDLHEGIHQVNIPYYIKLGDYFSRFLYEQNKKPETSIEDTDKKKNRFAWEFFATDLYGLQQRRLDPNLNLVQNKIKQQASIRIVRMYEPLKLLKDVEIKTHEISE